MLNFKRSLTLWFYSTVLAVTVLSVESLHAQPFAYVANAGSNTVAVVNPWDSGIAAQISVPSGPTALAVTPDGKCIQRIRDCDGREQRHRYYPGRAAPEFGGD